MTNLFENEIGVFHVLVNSEGKHSLWPTFVVVPDGWSSGFGPDIFIRPSRT